MFSHARRILILSLALLTSLAVAACGSRGASGTPVAPGAEGDAAIGAFEPVSALLQANCATSACHSAGRGAGDLVLEPDVAWGNLVDAASSQQDGATLVVPGDPDGSYLLAKLRGADGIRGSRMPIGRAPLLDEDLTVISDWIAAGAGE